MTDARRTNSRERVYAYIESVPYSPTMREIGEHVGLSAPTVFKHIRSLQKDGLVVQIGGRIYPSDRIDNGQDAA